MTAMDLLLLAHSLDRVTIPVAGRQSKTGDEFIRKCHYLIEDCHIPGFFDPDNEMQSKVVLGNGSEIDPIPGGSPHAIRSMRAPALAIDEYAFNPHPETLWRAARGVISEGGQASILSTHNGADTKFFEIVEDAKAGRNDFVLFSFPAHDQTKWDRTVSIQEQVASGRLKLIAPWLDLKEMDKFRREDLAGYEQEYLAMVIDDALNLIARSVVQAATATERIDWEATYPVEAAAWFADQGDAESQGHLALAELGLRIPYRPEGNINPVGVGVDFASKQDLAAFVAWETLPGGLHMQRWACVLHRAPTWMQVALLRTVVRVLRPVVVGIDFTGPGTGLFEYAAKIPGTSMVPIHFGGKTGMPEAEGARVPIKKALALTLSRVLADKKGLLVHREHPIYDLQARHLSAVRRADLDAPRKEGEGHADLFWANAIALYLAEVSGPVNEPPPDISSFY